MIWLPIDYPSLNDYIKIERTNKYAGAKVKKQYTNTTMYLSMNKGKIKTPCRLKFTWYVKNKRTDPDNTAFAKKFVLDGLVKAGVLPDDTFKHIKGFIDDFKVIDNVHKEIGVMIERIEVE